MSKEEKPALPEGDLPAESETGAPVEETSREDEPLEGDAKRIQDLQTLLLKANQEKAEVTRSLGERIAELSGKVDAVMQGRALEPTEGENLFEFLDDPKAEEDLFGDAKNVIGLQKKTVAALAKVLQSRDSHYEGLLRGLEAKIEELDPDRLTLKDRIAELKQNPDYKGFTDKQLVVVAKNMKEPAKEDRFAGSPGGSGAGRIRAKPDDAQEAEIKRIMRTIREA